MKFSDQSAVLAMRRSTAGLRAFASTGPQTPNPQFSTSTFNPPKPRQMAITASVVLCTAHPAAELPKGALWDLDECSAGRETSKPYTSSSKCLGHECDCSCLVCQRRSRDRFILEHTILGLV